MGVHTPDTDIDALCVVPRHIDRHHFDEDLGQMLKDQPAVTELTIVSSAFVPVIKMEFDGVQIDLLFAKVAYKEIGEELNSLMDDNILRDCDDASIRSLNGCRVTDMILRLVPNKENFRITLRCIKLWAKNRGVYSNMLGYPGGVAYAILVAHICIIFPKMTPNRLLHYFFTVYINWEWGCDKPILLTELKNNKESVPFSINEQLLYKKSRDALMPIITPAFPS